MAPAMPEPLTVTLSHRLGRAEARRRIADGLDQIRSQVAPYVSAIDYAWNGDTLDFTVVALRQRVIGRIDVHDDDVRIEVGLPLLLRMAANRILTQVRRQGALLLDKPKE